MLNLKSNNANGYQNFKFFTAYIWWLRENYSVQKKNKIFCEYNAPLYSLINYFCLLLAGRQCHLKLE